jgi:outer membrane scaffolding protein for murein synthesis (MipA/OmpV family)
VNLTPELILGAQVAYEQGRDPDDSDFLKSRNLAEVDPGASLGAHLEWNHRFGPVPVNVIARVRKHTDSDRGTQADLRITAGIFARGPVAAGVFIQPTWASAKSTSSFYGITPQQAAVSGLPAYDPGSGLLATSVGLIYSVALAEHWVIVGNFEARRLHGDAARSPITERRSAYSAAAGLAYRW